MAMVMKRAIARKSMRLYRRATKRKNHRRESSGSNFYLRRSSLWTEVGKDFRLGDQLQDLSWVNRGKTREFGSTWFPIQAVGIRLAFQICRRLQSVA